MTNFTKILTLAKIGKFYGKRYDYHGDNSGLFDMSDKEHFRVLSFFRHLLCAYLLLGVMYYCPSTSFSLFTGDSPMLQKGVGANRPGVIQIKKKWRASP